MNRELALKIVLAVVGLLFIALGYPMVVFIRQEPALSMQFSLYVTLRVFLLLAIRNPSEDCGFRMLQIRYAEFGLRSVLLAFASTRRRLPHDCRPQCGGS
jgi:hypothetical protein